jgi:hypothetical protein
MPRRSNTYRHKQAKRRRRAVRPGRARAPKRKDQR